MAVHEGDAVGDFGGDAAQQFADGGPGERGAGVGRPVGGPQGLGEGRGRRHRGSQSFTRLR